MSSVMKRLRNKRSQGDKFQITVSASSLVLECEKEKWHPCKLAIVWNKEKPKLSSTKPVLWQGGFKNPYRGIIVWPEPDPVKTKLTLFKNSGKELYQYQDKPWQILVQNVTPSGKRKVIAVGYLDISEYIMEDPTSHDITVTLKPVKKTVISGSLEFTLSSVILEDGVPCRTDKEIFDEIMKDAITELERKKSLQKARKSNGQGSKSSSQMASGHKAPVSDTAARDFQEAASCSHSNIVGQRKVNSKAPFYPPPLQAASLSASPAPRPAQLPPSSQRDCEVKQTEEKASNKKDDKHPTELDSFGEKEFDERQCSLSSENAPDLFKETPVKDAEESDSECTNKNLDQADGNNNFPRNSDANIVTNDGRDEDGCPAVPLKRPLVHLIHYVPVDIEKSPLSQGREKHGHRSTPGKKPSRSDGLSSDKTRSFSAVEVSSSSKETPMQKEQTSPKTVDLAIDTSAVSEVHPKSLLEASPSKGETLFNQEESAPCITDPEASTPSETAGHATVVHSATLKGSIVARETELSNILPKSRPQSEDGLPISQHIPELSEYIQEETSLLQDEIASLEKVSTKLEKEIQRANKTPGCEEELEGLNQDWTSLNKCKAELISRKQDLEMLFAEESLEECVNGIRQELMFLLELEGWRKTYQHKACEIKLTDALVSLARGN